MESTCPRCQRTFYWRQKTQVDQEGPATCGRKGCYELDEWSDEAWEGRARMARARREAGEFLHRWVDDEGRAVIEKVTGDPLNDLDREALRRAERS